MVLLTPTEEVVMAPVGDRELALTPVDTEVAVNSNDTFIIIMALVIIIIIIIIIGQIFHIIYQFTSKARHAGIR